jgi:preprotein translocase subunit SecY
MSIPVKGNLPLMVNMAGMIPLIFAQSLLTFPAIVASYFVGSKTEWVANLAGGIQSAFGGESGWYSLMYFLWWCSLPSFILTFFQQQNYGENLKRVGAQIPASPRRANPTLSHKGSTPHLPFQELCSWAWSPCCPIWLG